MNLVLLGEWVGFAELCGLDGGQEVAVDGIPKGCSGDQMTQSCHAGECAGLETGLNFFG